MRWLKEVGTQRALKEGVDVKAVTWGQHLELRLEQFTTRSDA